MGVLTIKIPQEINKSYQVEDSVFGAQILNELESHISDQGDVHIVLPRRADYKNALKEVVGIWAERPETADEIAIKIRRRNNGVE